MNANATSFKVNANEISPCELLQNFRPVSSEEDVVPGNGGSPAKQGVGPLSRRCEYETARKIDQSITYMRQHLDKPLQASMLASLVHISPSHFFALFKYHTGCAPIDYFTRLRMQHACRLLDSTSSSVKEIADALGYTDPFYFSRVFKSVNRIAPSKYRVKPKLPQDEAGNDDLGKYFSDTTKSQTPPHRSHFTMQMRSTIFNAANAETCAA